MICLFGLRITHESTLGSKLKLRSWIMPKNRNYIPDLQKNRRKHQEKKIQKADGPAYLQFLGSGAVGAPRSIYFFTDYNRYFTLSLCSVIEQLFHFKLLLMTNILDIFSMSVKVLKELLMKMVLKSLDWSTCLLLTLFGRTLVDYWEWL